MATIRVLSEDDIPAAAELFARVYPEYRWPSRAAYESYFRNMLFENPWRGLGVPSWAAEESGRLCGFYAVMPRPMRLRGRPIRVGVGCQIIVDAHQGGALAALQLAQACMSGPQDLTLADGASGEVRRAWIGLGGASPPLYSLHWTRPLRPARYALSLLEDRASLLRFLALAARPLGVACDVLAGRLFQDGFRWNPEELAEDALDSATMLAHLPEIHRSYALQPVYDAGSLAWLLEQTERKTRHGNLRARAVRDAKRRLLGWYAYYLRPGGASEVLQIAAHEGHFEDVLERLLADAWRRGAAAVRGRLDPRHAQELSRHQCLFRWDGTWTLVHSRDPEVMAAIREDQAFISRLEGEWWLRFLGG